MTEDMDETEVSKKKISQADFDKIAQTIAQEYTRRKNKRRKIEKQWVEVDRQLAMEPSVLYKRNSDGTTNKKTAWMPEIELPNQSQTLEILCADTKRMMFPQGGEFYRAKAYSSDEFVNNFLNNTPFIVGSDIDPPSQITHDNINDFVSGFVSGKLKNFDHEKAWDLISSEAFKYGVGIGRARLAAKSIFKHDAAVTYNQSIKTPILAPLSIKNVYLDDQSSNYMSFGAYIAPSIIQRQTRKLADLRASMMSKQDNVVGQGWIGKSFDGLEGDKNGNVELLEFEGDFVMDTKGEKPIFWPNVILTVLIGTSGQEKAEKLVRIEQNPFPFSSYIIVPYHQDYIEDPYGSSPLLKGRPIQASASETLNRLLQVAMLNAQPPIKYDKDDMLFKNKGGPLVYPGAQWATGGDIEVMKIGDPSSLLVAYQSLLSQYSDVTGVNAPRLGAQTVSHTTAYAKDQELERGQIRTVNFVRSVLKSAMERWLGMCYYMAREQIENDSEQVYMSTYNAYVNVKSDLLPETVCFEVYGAGGPAETIAMKQQRQQAVMTAVQLNQVAVQAGLAKPLNFDAITRQLLKEAGISDVDVYFAVPEGPAAGPALQAVGGGAPAGNPSALTVALQGLQGSV